MALSMPVWILLVGFPLSLLPKADIALPLALKSDPSTVILEADYRPALMHYD
jgi:hypothetical protein